MSKKNKQKENVGTCLECQNSYDYYNINAEGRFILAKCLKKNVDVLLRSSCNLFKLKNDENK